MSIRTFELIATNAAGISKAQTSVTIADPPSPPAGIVEFVGRNTMTSVDPDPQRKSVYAGIEGLAGILGDCGATYSSHYGTHGALVVTGGGHGAYGGNIVLLFDLDPAVYLWKRLNEPSLNLVPVQVSPPPPPYEKVRVFVDPKYGEYLKPVAHAIYAMPGELPGESDGTPAASHTFSCLTAIPGGTRGLLLEVTKPNYVWVGAPSSGWSHTCDLVTGEWKRYSTNAAPQRHDSLPPSCVSMDEGRNVVWCVMPGRGTISTFDLATKTHSGILGYTLDAGIYPTSPRTIINGLMLVWWCPYTNWGTPTKTRLSAFDCAKPSGTWKDLTLVGDLPPDTFHCPTGFDWDEVNDCGYMYRGTYHDEANSDNEHVWRVQKPASGKFFTDPWQITKIKLPQPFPPTYQGATTHWRYCKNIHKFALISGINHPVSLWTPPDL